MTSKWPQARDEVYNFVDYLNRSLGHPNNFTKDFIMKNCLVLADLPVAYKVQNFTEQNLSIMQHNWPRVKNAIERCVRCVNSFGIDENNLTARNALIPVIYYLLANPDLTLMGTSIPQVRNANVVRRWLIASLLNGVFGGSSDSMLTNVRDALYESRGESDFPIDQINRKISEGGRKATFDGVAVDNLLNTVYGGKQVFLAISILYDDNNWGDRPIDVDHIFPSKMFGYQEMLSGGRDAETWRKYHVLHEKVANLELLTHQENLEKLDTPFDEWIRTRDSSFKRRHLIPDDPELWKFENFERFVAERETLIKKRLTQLFGSP
jgi:hypothetical protein